jgi:Flp pilus assembly pilin Flp
MGTLLGFLRTFWHDRSGLSAVEYAMLAAFVTVGIVAAGGQLSDAVFGAMTHATGCLDGTIPPSSC